MALTRLARDKSIARQNPQTPKCDRSPFIPPNAIDRQNPQTPECDRLFVKIVSNGIPGEPGECHSPLRVGLFTYGWVDYGFIGNVNHTVNPSPNPLFA